MAIKRVGEKNQINEANIKQILEEKMNNNRDGFYVAVPTMGIRTMDKPKALQLLDDVELDNFFCHFRIATTGKIGIDNVQGWNKDGWIFAHNGGMTGYEEKTEQGYYKQKIEYEKSDSLAFFESLTDILKTVKSQKDKAVSKAIQQAVYKLDSFWGRCLLYHQDTDRLFLFGDWEVYDYDGYILISSAILAFEGRTDNKHTHGLSFEYEKLASSLIGHSRFDGIAVIKSFTANDWQFKKLGQLNKPIWKNWQTNNYNNHKTKTYGYDTDRELDYCGTKYKYDDKKQLLLPDKNHKIHVPKKEDKQSVPEHIKEHIKIFNDDDDMLLARLEKACGLNQYGVEVYQEDGSLGLEKDYIHDIYGYCCVYSPKKCQPIDEFREYKGLDEQIRISYGSDGTEMVIDSKKLAL